MEKDEEVEMPEKRRLAKVTYKSIVEYLEGEGYKVILQDIKGLFRGKMCPQVTDEMVGHIVVFVNQKYDKMMETKKARGKKQTFSSAQLDILREIWYKEKRLPTPSIKEAVQKLGEDLRVRIVSYYSRLETRSEKLKATQSGITADSDSAETDTAESDSAESDSAESDSAESDTVTVVSAVPHEGRQKSTHQMHENIGFQGAP